VFAIDNIREIMCAIGISVAQETLAAYENQYRLDVGQQVDDNVETFKYQAITPYLLSPDILQKFFIYKPLATITYKKCVPSTPIETVYGDSILEQMRICSEELKSNLDECLMEMRCALDNPTRIILSPLGGSVTKKVISGSLRRQNTYKESKAIMIVDHSNKYSEGNVLEKVICYCKLEECSTKLELSCENVMFLEKVMELYYAQSILDNKYYVGYTLDDLKMLRNLGGNASHSFVVWSRFFQAILGVVTDKLTLPVIVFMNRSFCDIRIGLLEVEEMAIVNNRYNDCMAEKLFSNMIEEKASLNLVSQQLLGRYHARIEKEKESQLDLEDNIVRNTGLIGGVLSGQLGGDYPDIYRIYHVCDDKDDGEY
jgi:hypothetical protein